MRERLKLLVVVVNYGITDLTVQCLRALEPEVASNGRVGVAVCENGTGPQAVRHLAEAIMDEGWGEWAYLRAVHPNRGFTGGNNAIIREAMNWPEPPEYFLLLNADAFVQPGALSELIRFVDAHPTAGIAGSRIENMDGSWQCSPFRYQTFISEFTRGIRLKYVTQLLSRWTVTLPPSGTPRMADWVTGASMLIRRQVFEEVGLLDEDLYTYFDDIDFCMNARRVGWATWYVPASRVRHLCGQSTGVGRREGIPNRRPDYWFQARRRFFLKNYGPRYAALADAAFLAGFALWRLRRVLQRKPDTDPPHMLWDSFRHSVFCTGFRLIAVPNPAMQPSPHVTAQRDPAPCGATNQ